jgi:RNA polymerase sigma factor (sigma-70 family)
MATDTNLLQSLKRGEEDAFRRVYQSCYRSASSAVFNHGGSDEDAEDIFQEALFVFVKQLRTPGFDIKVQLCTYLYAVVRNLWLKKLRDHSREIPVAEETIQTLKDQNPEDNAIDILENLRESELKFAQVLRALEQIGEECKKVILFSYYEQRPDAEIAQILNYAYDFVRLKRYRCMNRLRDILGL